MNIFSRFVVTLCLVLGAISPLRADTEVLVSKNNPKMLAAFRPVIARSSQSTVRVLCQEKEAALGTVVRADGYILTKASELKEPIACVLKNGKSFAATVVGIEQKNDLALLRISARDLTPIEWADSKNASTGNWVVTPGNSTEPVAIGVVSVPTRTLTGLDRALSGRGAPPPNSGYLGVGIEPSVDGAKISAVEDNGPAAKAGIKPGDVVIAVAGSKVPDPEQLVKLIQAFKPNDQVLMKIKRGAEELELKAKLGKRPSGQFDRADFQNNLGSKLSTRRGGFATILQHDTILRPADCGGPIVDIDGKAVGLNIARAGRVESYALPTEVVQAALPELLSGKLAPKKEDEVSKALSWQRKLNDAEVEVKAAEERLDAAKKNEVQKDISAARKALKDAQTKYEKLKRESEEAKNNK
jgi:serine protease Do